MVETTVRVSDSRAGYFARPVGGFHHQIVAPRRAGRDAQLPQRLQNDVGRDAFVVTRFAGHKGETVLPEVVNTALPPPLRRASRMPSCSMRRVLHSFQDSRLPITTVSALRHRKRILRGHLAEDDSSTAVLNQIVGIGDP